MLQYLTLIPATTGSYESAPFAVYGPRIPATVYGCGLENDDEAKIQFSCDGGATWHDLAIDGEGVVLDVDNTARSIYAPGLFRAKKNDTTGTVSVELVVPRDGAETWTRR